MIERIVLNSEEEKRVLDTLEFMTEHPETGYREWQCSAFMESQFRSLGYEPQPFGDIPGFTVKIDTGREGPCVLVLGELDAVKCGTHPKRNPETDAVHACGHNAQSAALVGIAAALKREGALEGLSGSILLCSVPAEEMIERDYRDTLIKEGRIKYYGGKTELISRGVFDGVDLAFMVHTGKSLSINGGSVGIISKKIVYKGRAAHAGSAPERGINALYAATLGLNAINSIRETFTEGELVRVHPIITKGGTVVNGIPDLVEIECYVRGRTYEAMVNTNKKVNRALIGAALAIGANVELQDSPGYAPLVNDENMKRVAALAAERVYTELPITVSDGISTGSTDMGDISLLYPTVHPYAPGAAGADHGEDYRIEHPDLACVKCAEWQLEMLRVLLTDGAKEAQRIKREFTPAFANREEYFAYVEAIRSSGDRITYRDGGAEIKL